MKSTIFSMALAVMIAGSALAVVTIEDDLNGAPFRGQAGTTLQAWSFSTDDNPVNADVSMNEYGQPVVEMDIGNQGDGDLFFDAGDGYCGGLIGHGNPDDFTARPGQTMDLVHRSRHILGGGVGHGLHRDRRHSADLNRSKSNGSRFFTLYAKFHGSIATICR